MAELISNLQICGNILCSENYSYFALQCTECDEPFGQWSSFLRHLQDKHALTDIEDVENGTYFEGEELGEDNFIELNDETNVNLNLVKEEHSIFLETKDETEMENEEFMTEIIEEVENIFQIESSAEYTQDTQFSVEASSLEENLEDTKRSIEEDERLKQFKFNLSDSSCLPMSLDFLNVLQGYPVLWDPKHSQRRNPRKRLSAQVKIKLFFHRKKIEISDQVLQETLSNVLRKYRLALQEKKETGNVDTEAELLLKNCAYLDEVVKVDLDSDSEEDDVAESSSKYNSNDELLSSTSKYQNRIIFSDPHPLIEDFITRYRDNPILWDHSLENYNNRAERKKIFTRWIEIFKEKYGIQFTYDELSYSMQEFRRIYFKNVQRRDANLDLDDYAKFILEKGQFLPPRPTVQQIKCKHCQKVFHHEHTLRRHIYVDHRIGEMPFKCSFCDTRFEDHLAHRRHELRYHYKDYKFICEYCKKPFFTRDELERHLVKHTGEKKFVCELCGKGFAKKTNLRNHDTRVHLRQRNFPCTMCPKAFYTKRLLQDHINAHLNIRDKICPTCGKGFTSHHSLIRHKQIHSEVKRYACKLCDARFHQFVGLNSHMKNTHKYVRSMNETASDVDEKLVDIST